jgi:hypothetical protein
MCLDARPRGSLEAGLVSSIRGYAGFGEERSYLAGIALGLPTLADVCPYCGTGVAARELPVELGEESMHECGAMSVELDLDRLPRASFCPADGVEQAAVDVEPLQVGLEPLGVVLAPAVAGFVDPITVAR